MSEKFREKWLSGYHTVLQWLSYCATVAIILCCSGYHTVLQWLSYCATVAIILCCSGYHTVLQWLSYRATVAVIPCYRAYTHHCRYFTQFLTAVDGTGHSEPHLTPFCNFFFTIGAMKTHPLLNPLNPELNPICYLLALLGAHHFLHVSRIRVNGVNEVLPWFLRLSSDIDDIRYTEWASSHFRTMMMLTQSSLKSPFVLELPVSLTVWKYCVGQENLHV